MSTTTFTSGRFTLIHLPEGGYVTSWDTWEDAAVAFDETRGDRIPPGYKLYDNETGRTWHAGYPYEWEAAST